MFRRRFVLVILFAFTISDSFAQSKADEIAKRFSKGELQEDFLALRNRYENQLVNLYIYTPKKELDLVFDSLYQNLREMTAREFYSYITPLSSLIKDGHSNIFPPKKETERYNESAVFFPLNIFWNRERMYVYSNFSDDSTITPGTEIISINGKSSKEVMQFLIDRQVRDGLNDNYATWVLNSYFREYYSYHFGHPEKFDMVLKQENSGTEQKQIVALSKKRIAINRESLYHGKAGAEMSLQIDSILSTATFKFISWEAKSLTAEIDKLFRVIEENKINNLVVDLRDNQGGDFKPAIQMLSYLLDKPFEYFSEVKSIAKSTNTDQILKNVKGEMLGIHQPQKRVFKGKLYVLMNGGSFSNTASFCSRIKFYQRGIIIGEESGGNAVVFSGVFGLRGSITLPNTKISIDNSNYKMTVIGGAQNAGRGVQPDLVVAPTIEDFLNNVDAAMVETHKLIAGNRE